VQKILAETGMKSERIAMFNMSSAMGAQFAEATREMTDRMRSLGPNPLLPLPARAERSASPGAERLNHHEDDAME
jgi:F420-non-reducing hydrogenase iron-sulfur subunit